MRNIQSVEAANRFLDRTYIAEFNRRFRVPAEQPGTAFLPLAAQDLDCIFSLHHQRVVNRDNTVQFENRCLQIEPVRWRGTLSGCAVTVRQHLDGDLSLSYGQHLLGRYPHHAAMIRAPDRRTVAQSLRDGKVQKPTFPPRLEIRAHPRGIPTFPPPPLRRLAKFKNRTIHLLPKADIFTC